MARCYDLCKTSMLLHAITVIPKTLDKSKRSLQGVNVNVYVSQIKGYSEKIFMYLVISPFSLFTFADTPLLIHYMRMLSDGSPHLLSPLHVHMGHHRPC